MIEESEIASFPQSVQDRIRADLVERVRLGYKLQHLMLSRDGKVMLDYEAVEIDADEGFFKSRKSRE